MGKINKKARREKDKYYHYAKEQGYRARSAFKLIQLNKKYDFLGKSNVVLDLCAAPGGWLQVCSKYMPMSSTVIGVDINPIRPIRNVITHQADINSTDCRRLLKKDLGQQKCDVVLHDGAPNVGADWRQDAYDQNVLTLQSLKLACDFLKEGGMFVTKIFRSKDYNALLWVFNKLFNKVDATKPHSSRGASAEIFVVCKKYLAPSKIDARLLDPIHVFRDDVPTTNKEAAEQEQRMSVETLNKQLVAKKPRQRQGYEDTEALLVKKNMSVADFIESNDPVRVISEATSLLFDSRAKESGYLDSQHTTEDIKAFCADLKVLGRKDFKELLKWRLQVRKDLKKAIKDKQKEDKEAENDEDSGKTEQGDKEPEDETEELENELHEEYQKKKRESKREAKRKRKDARRAALGLNNQSVDMDTYNLEGGDPDIGGYTQFSRINPQTAGPTEIQEEDEDDKSIGEISLDSDEENGNENDDSMDRENEEEEDDDREAYLAALEDQLDYQYNQYLAMRNSKEAFKGQEEGVHAGGKKLSRRQRMEAEAKAQLKQKEDKLDYTHQQYLKMLAAPPKDRKEDKDDDDDEDDDSSSDEDIEEEDDEEASEDDEDNDEGVSASRWFSQSLFDDVTAEESIEPPSQQIQALSGKKRGREVQDESAETNGKEENEMEEDESMDLMANIPKSEREKRKEKLRKKREKENQRSKKTEDQGFEVVSAKEDDTNEGKNIEAENNDQKTKERKKLIEAGMGRKAQNKGKEDGQMEIVPQEPDQGEESPDPRDEEYDSDTHAEILALGKMMKKHTRAKALVDASYNRYSFDDPALPSWFAADEAAHFRPQLPVDKSEVDKIKERFREISARPVHKVAEARARKKRKLAEKVNKARRHIANIANDQDLSNVSKTKAAEKAMKKAKLKKPETVSVVSGKDGRQHGKVQKGAKVKRVDKRMLADKRGENKKRKGGKRGKSKGGKRGR
eukprot:gb/GECG01013125.1/.p1 GENE.gb/GECG01013125.1/~~gb/GECG01013125.1/.p1  ORF type:complete len:964 (+),score=237.77 gb/GECG01013125.1/:1-2892(+)